MSEYTPTFTKPYPDGWKNKPDETTPITAEIMDAYDDAIESIETYLSENPINKSGSGDGGDSGDINLTDIVVENSISMGRTSDSIIGENSIAIGYFVEASGENAFATGMQSKATNKNAFAEGSNTTASSNSAHAEGQMTTASGVASHSEGLFTSASSDYQHVQGKFNVEDAANKYAHIVGGGTSPSNRKNIHTVDWQGNAMYTGTVETQGIILKDTVTEQKYMLTIANESIGITAVN